MIDLDNEKLLGFFYNYWKTFAISVFETPFLWFLV